MATINLTFETTAAQGEKLAKVLARMNAARVEQGEEEFATIEAYLRWVTIEGVKSYIRSQKELDAEELKEAFDAADSATQTQVEGLLGISL